MKVMIASLCLILGYTSMCGQGLSSAEHQLDVDALLASTHQFALRSNENAVLHASDQISMDGQTGKKTPLLQDSKYACDFIIHPSLHKQRYLLISYVGPGQSFCFVTNEDDQVVYRHPLQLSSAYTWINLHGLPVGNYQLNVNLQGQTYQQSFTKE